MEKKNNDGKTFGDIFSKANEEKKTVSFNSVKEETSNTDNLGIGDVFKSLKETDVNSDNKKTFNSIFEDNSIPNVKKEKESSSSIFDQAVKQDKNKEDVSSFSNIFDKIKDDEVKEKDRNDQKDDYEKVDKGVLFDKKEENNQEIEDKIIDDDIFFDNNKRVDDEENDKKNIDDKQDSLLIEDVEGKAIDGNIFFDNKQEDDKEEDRNIVKDKQENVFFSDVEDKTIDNNIFFDNKQEEQEENIDDKPNDIFFGDNVDKKDDDINKDKKEQDEDKELINEEVSPFFVDDSSSEVGEKEVNPFFDNKINLVEKPEYSNKDVSGKIDVSNVQNFDVKIKKKKPTFFQSILGVLSYALFIWLLLIGIALLVYVLDIKIRSAKGDNSPPKYGAYVVLTGSMLPEIQVYDVVITKKQDAKNLKEGDVITFASSDTRFEGTIITHRIIKKNYSSKTKSYTFQTKGDNNNVADSALVTPANIYGKVILKIPKLGYLRDFLASDGGWILVILLPCLAVVSYDIVKISKGLRRNRYKKIKIQSR